MASNSARVTIPNILNPAEGRVGRACQDGIQYSAILRGHRFFHAWKAGKYPFPCDVGARSDYDILNAAIMNYCHGMGGWNDLLLLPDTRLVPINCMLGGPPNKILDLGCGSGLWVLCTARMYPKATVVGVDLVDGQDMLIDNAVWRVPNSTQGALDFDEDLSMLGLASFDYVHLTQLYGAVADEEALLRKVFELTVPATGQIELAHIDWTFRTANTNPLPVNGPLCILHRLIMLASEQRKVPINPDPSLTGPHLTNAGFIDVIHRTHILPLTSWSTDRCQHKIGQWMSTILREHLLDRAWTCTCFLEGLSLELLTLWLKMDPAEVRELVTACVFASQDRRSRVYVNLHTWTARRPGLEHKQGNQTPYIQPEHREREFFT